MKKLLLLAMLGVSAGVTVADEITDERWWTPVQLNLASPLGLPWADRDVKGLRMNLIYGHSLDVCGLDLGVVGANRGETVGLQMNGFNYNDGIFRGVQLGALGSFTVKSSYGVQLAGLINWGIDDNAGLEAGLLNFSVAYTGAQIGFLNWDSGLAEGFGLGFINSAQTDAEGGFVGCFNYCKGNLHGCQLGVFNMAFGHSEGVQIGVFNAAEDHNGAQIGLLNLNANGKLPLMAVVNVNFR